MTDEQKKARNRENRVQVMTTISPEYRAWLDAANIKVCDALAKGVAVLMNGDIIKQELKEKDVENEEIRKKLYLYVNKTRELEDRVAMLEARK